MARQPATLWAQTTAQKGRCWGARPRAIGPTAWHRAARSSGEGGVLWWSGPAHALAAAARGAVMARWQPRGGPVDGKCRALAARRWAASSATRRMAAGGRGAGESGRDE